VKTAGIIFSNIHDQELPELTKFRTIASVPVAARYRLIDFALSGLANAGIEEIGIITKSKYHSLVQHVGAGKPWDLDRKHGGVTIISPFVDVNSGALYTNRLEALQNSIGFVEELNCDNIVLADSDLLANIPYSDIIAQHEESGADITAVYKEINFKRKRDNYNLEFTVAEDGTLAQIKVHNELKGSMNFGMNIYVIKRNVLLDMIHDSLVYGYKSFSREILPYYLKRANVKTYEFTGFLYAACSLQDYFEANMAILNDKNRNELFEQNGRSIYTQVRDSAPTIYGDTAEVNNSLIGDGCIIEGKVENSVIFRGVRIDEGATVRNSIVMQDSIIEAGTDLNYIVTEKNVVVRKGRNISGCEGYPFFISYGSVL
jgi:glucose-1-phosphate adenylyltransferase